MAGGVYLTLQHLSLAALVEHQRVVGIHMKVEHEVAELVVADTAFQGHGVSLGVYQVDVGEDDRRGVHDDGVALDGVARARPGQRQRRVLGRGTQQHVGQPLSPAYYHLTRRMAVQITQYGGCPVVDESQRHRVGIHIEFPAARTVEQRLTVQVDHLARRTHHVRVESQAVAYVQVHVGLTEIAVVQTHRVDMYARVYRRLAEDGGDIGATGQQAVEHDCLYGQDKRHYVRRVDSLQVDHQRVFGAGRAYAVCQDVLAAALEAEVAHLERLFGRRVGDMALAYRVERVAQRERARAYMQVHQRLVVVAVEGGDEVYVAGV